MSDFGLSRFLESKPIIVRDVDKERSMQDFNMTFDGLNSSELKLLLPRKMNRTTYIHSEKPGVFVWDSYHLQWEHEPDNTYTFTDEELRKHMFESQYAPEDEHEFTKLRRFNNEFCDSSDLEFYLCVRETGNIPVFAWNTQLKRWVKNHAT